MMGLLRTEARNLCYPMLTLESNSTRMSAACGKSRHADHFFQNKIRILE